MMDGVTLVSVAHLPGTDRAAARMAIRAALCASVTDALGVKEVRVDALPGAAPRLIVDGEITAISVAISHTASYSFAAWHA
ncbi:hypothetical protein LP420_41605 [Massilia sp. B-10]|nr:hypothetical protein LP420_41605 [Massilia sp. B-10]UUZ54571.1 hypothetical protein LP419_40930 [Massilia sp. H-1]